MVDTIVTDAAVFPQDEGVGSITDGNETWDSAGLLMLLAQAAQSGSYVRSDSELDFSGHSAANDTVDVQPGVAYISLSTPTVDVQSGKGGSSPPSYDTTLTVDRMPAIAVVVPSAVTVDVQDSTASEVWLAYATDGSVSNVDAGDVYIRSDDTGSMPALTHPSVKLGSANPDDSSADTLANRFSSPTFDAVTATILNSANVTAATTGDALTKAASGSDVEFESVAPVNAEYWVSTSTGDLDNEIAVPIDPSPTFTDGQILEYNSSTSQLEPVDNPAAVEGAPDNAEYWVNSSDADLSNEIVVPINTSIGSFSDEDILKYNATTSQFEKATDQTGSGGGGFNQTTQTTDYSVSDGESVWANSSTSMVNVTLPTPAQSVSARVRNIDDTNGVVLVPNGGEDIDGSTTNETVPADATVEVESDGTDWRTV